LRELPVTGVDVAIQQGEQATHFFVLVRGRLRVTQVTSEGQQVVIRMVNPGDLFGIAKALARLDYPGTATAVSESCALCWPMRMWTSLLERYPSLAMQAMQTMGSRLLEAQLRVRELSTEEVERRVAHAVLRLANQSGRKEPGGVRIDVPISKPDIAEMTGTTLHTVVDGADTPEWLGTDQVRAARFEAGRMFLRPPPRVIDGREIHRELAWERLVPETG
jgi:CRP-like cAMP-binding protein